MSKPRKSTQRVRRQGKVMVRRAPLPLSSEKNLRAEIDRRTGTFSSLWRFDSKVSAQEAESLRQDLKTLEEDQALREARLLEYVRMQEEMSLVIKHKRSFWVRKRLEPPRLAEYLLWYLPRKSREAVMGDLEEEYHIIHQRFGARKAAMWYWSQVVTSFWPVVTNKIRTLIKLGAIGMVGDFLRRFIP